MKKIKSGSDRGHVGRTECDLVRAGCETCTVDNPRARECDGGLRCLSSSARWKNGLPNSKARTCGGRHEEASQMVRHSSMEIVEGRATFEKR